jgi:hypothetical protein
VQPATRSGSGPHNGLVRKWIVLVAAVVVVVGAAAAVVVAYVRGHQDKGYPPATVAVPAACRLSEATLTRAHTTNPWHFSDRGDQVECYWRQTEGRDGIDTRTLGYTITRTGDAQAEYTQATADFTPVSGLGDEAGYTVAPYSGGMTDLRLVARKGSTVVDVGYLGQDQDFLGTSPMPAEEGRAVAAAVARELLAE